MARDREKRNAYMRRRYQEDAAYRERHLACVHRWQDRRRLGRLVQQALADGLPPEVAWIYVAEAS
jgi:hypothetical protein